MLHALNVISFCLWMTSILRVVPYCFEATRDPKIVATALILGVVAGVLYKPKSLITYQRMLLTGALFASALPLTRLIIIHTGTVGAIASLTALFWTGTFVRPFPKHLLSVGFILSVFTFTLHLFEQREISQTTSSAIIGISAMTLAIVYLWWQTHNTKTAITSLAFLALIAAIFTKAPTDSLIHDNKNSRYTFITHPTSYGTGHTLLINGMPRFVSQTEQRYHACTTSLPISLMTRNHHPLNQALVLFGGDGMIVRNLLTIKSIREITVLDPDRTLNRLATDNPIFRSYNLDSMRNLRTKAVIASPYDWLTDQTRWQTRGQARGQIRGRYDLVIADLPFPSLGFQKKYYTAEFTRSLIEAAQIGGVVAISVPFQFTSLMNATLRTVASNKRLLLYKDLLTERSLILVFPLIFDELDEKARFLTVHCSPLKPTAGAKEHFLLDDIVTGRFGGEERAPMLIVQNAARLSLPR